VALVPFVTGVNVKADGVFSMDWIDQTAQAPWHGNNFNLTGGAKTNHLTLFTQLGRAWKGCVEARAEPYDTQDTAPDPSTPATLFVPWFWPDEPDGGIQYADDPDYRPNDSNENKHYTNNYLKDDFGSTATNTASGRQKNTSKYPKRQFHAPIDETPTKTSGPNKSCPDAITPLTNDTVLMQQRIEAMMPWDNSGTNVAQGMMWGWSVLSPTPPFTEGAPYEDDQQAGLSKTQKAMIVLTDGENQVWGGFETHNKSDYTAYGYVRENRLGTTDRNTAVTKINAKVTELCGKIKAKKIRLYTITFQLNSATAQELFRQCATKPEMYYNSPSTTELKGIFQRIANDLNDLHFSR
jgi:hypothetical protein